MVRAALHHTLLLFACAAGTAGIAAIACSSGKPTMSSASASTAKPVDTAKPADTATPAKPADPPADSPADSPAVTPCDFKVVAMSDPAQKQIRCANGESFVIRQAKDGKWYPEMRVRAGIVPGYATPDEAGRARCCPAPE
jgi:hypothetical protein